MGKRRAFRGSILQGFGVNRSLIPDDLDISDYEAVAEHYGYGNGLKKSRVLQK